MIDVAVRNPQKITDKFSEKISQWFLLVTLAVSDVADTQVRLDMTLVRIIAFMKSEKSHTIFEDLRVYCKLGAVD